MTRCSRRRFLATLLAGGVAGHASTAAGKRGEVPTADAVAARLGELESAARGRLGVHVIDSASGREFSHRADERFMTLSSFKYLAAALVLHRVDTGRESLTRRIAYTKQDLVEWSPETARHVDGDGMTLAALCAAAITTSDNTAANLILASFGGPPALTAFARQLGDEITRLDRTEPDLNVPAAAPLDSTSPRAMAHTLGKLVLGDALSAASRRQLQEWLLANTTGGRRLKAGLPADWMIGDKTGSFRNSANDVGVIWPPGRAPLLVAAYLADAAVDAPAREATLAAVGALVCEIAA